MGPPRIGSLLAAFVCAAEAAAPTVVQYLLISQPPSAQVSYTRIATTGSQVSVGALQVLVSTGLVAPAGLALDQVRSRLYVTDPGNMTILAYNIAQDSGGVKLIASKSAVVLTNVLSEWIAVDNMGNLFFPDGSSNQIKRINSNEALTGNATATVVYDASSYSQVSSPAGLALDGIYAYWVNQNVGTQVGSLIKGTEVLGNVSLASPQVRLLSSNTNSSYGVCLAMNNVYYTQSAQTVYGMQKTGSLVTVVTNSLTSPRGCSFDGDGTVYVADNGANSIYSFPAATSALSLVQVQKVISATAPFDVAVYTGTSGALRMSVITLLLAVLGLQALNL